jgi:hypothetical protein
VAALQSLAGLQAMAGEAEQAMATADRAVARPGAARARAVAAATRQATSTRAADA